MGPSVDSEIDPQWKSWTATRSGLAVVSQYCPDVPYVEVEVPAGIRRVRRIVFTTVSHDQGYSGSAEHEKGTYASSTSWFEAAVVAPTGHDRAERIHVQHNLNAVYTKQKHVNTWDSRSSNAHKKQFLKAIRPLDRICVMPKTRHVGWLNFVYEAEIQVYGVEEEAPSPISLRVGSSTLDGIIAFDTLYRQLDIDTDEIRVLTLEPGAFQDDIVCKLDYLQLTDKEHVSYEALSYCWGDSGDTSTVKVTAPPIRDGGPTLEGRILVKVSLFNALRHLRLKDKPRILWGDAICINQLNNDERSLQVALMPQIYTRAARVLVWLGDATESVSKTLDSLAKIGQRYEQKKQNDGTENTRKELHRPILDGGSLLVDTDVFTYDYFRRTWVLQEVYNGREVLVHCGSYEVDWAQLIRLNRCLIKTMLIPNPVGKNVLPALFAGLFELTLDESNHRVLGYDKLVGTLDILDVFLRGLDLEATDPRDKVFALLTFGKETSAISTLPPSIAPDYNKNVDEVFASFTRWWIETHRSLRILSAIHVSVGRTWQTLSRNRLEIEDLDRPSWMIWHTGKSFWSRGTLGLSPSLSYSASQKSTPDVELLNSQGNPWVLSLSGKRIATIKSIGPYDYHRGWRHYQECDKSNKCGKCAMHVAYDNIYDPLDEWSTWRYGVQHQTKDVVGQLRRDNTRDEILFKLSDHFKAHWFLKRSGALLCHDDCCFEADNDSVGLCPPAARAGDVLVLLFGGNVPYVLRPHGDRFFLVGECFVKGYMRGQGMDEPVREGQWAGETFNLA